MNKIMMSLALIMFLVGCGVALDFENGVEMRPGEKAAEERFERGFGSPWVGGDPPHWPSYGQTYPEFYSIYRPGFPFSGCHYWTGVHIRPFRVCHPFCDCQFYHPRNYCSGWGFHG